jgi:DNA mismatch repair ATPase MutL
MLKEADYMEKTSRRKTSRSECEDESEEERKDESEDERKGERDEEQAVESEDEQAVESEDEQAVESEDEREEERKDEREEERKDEREEEREGERKDERKDEREEEEQEGESEDEREVGREYRQRTHYKKAFMRVTRCIVEIWHLLLAIDRDWDAYIVLAETFPSRDSPKIPKMERLKRNALKLMAVVRTRAQQIDETDFRALREMGWR